MRLTYFAQAREGFIKIGHAFQVRRRIKHLRRTVPAVHLLCVVTEPAPKICERFKEALAFDGWFHPSRELVDFIRASAGESDKLLTVQAREGLSTFGEWLRDRQISYAEAARALKVTRSYVQMLATGDATPSLKLAHRIMGWVEELDPGSLKIADLLDD